MSIVERVVSENQFQPEDLPAFQNKLYFEGRERRRHTERFGVLLFLSGPSEPLG